MSDAVQSPPPEFLRRDAVEFREGLTRVELVLDSCRVVGVIGNVEPARRLVDELNDINDPVVVMRDASMSDLAALQTEAQHFSLLQIKRDAILVAIPVGADARPTLSVEIVEKRPATATLVMPGLRVTGSVHLPPGVSPDAARLIGKGSFAPLTEAEVFEGSRARHEPLVVVNMARAVVYAPVGPCDGSRGSDR